MRALTMLSEVLAPLPPAGGAGGVLWEKVLVAADEDKWRAGRTAVELTEAAARRLIAIGIEAVSEAELPP